MQSNPNNPNNPNNPYGATAYGGNYPAGNNDPYSQNDSSGIEPTVLASQPRYPQGPQQPPQQPPYGSPSQPDYFSPPQQPPQQQPQSGYYPPQQPPQQQPQSGYYPPQQPPQSGYYPPQQPYSSGQYMPPQQPTPKRGGNRALLIVLAVLVVLLGVGAAIGIPVKVNIDNGNATATATTAKKNTAATAAAQAQAKAVTATAQAQAQATAAAVANVYPFSAKQVINDPMKDNNGGYGWKTSQVCKFVDGSYHVASTEANVYLECMAAKTDFSNFTYQVDAQLLQGYALGITFRESADAESFYMFAMGAGDNSYAVLYKAGKDSTLEVVKSGLLSGVDVTQTNQIGVVARDNEMTIYVNQKKITSFTDSGLSQGRIGVTILTEEAGGLTEAAFSNAKVWEL